MGYLRALYRGAEIGVMMAIGGSRFGSLAVILGEIVCIQALSWVVASGIYFAYPLIGRNLIAGLPFAISLGVSLMAGLVSGFIVSLVYTMTDPYAAIRRKK